MLNWRKMTDAEWKGFAGAVAFVDGERPQIADLKVDGRDAVAVWDRHGFNINVNLGDDIAIWANRLDEELGLNTLIRVAGRVMTGLRPTMTEAAIKALGFERV